MKHQIRFVIGNEKWLRPPIIKTVGLEHLTTIAHAKKELKQLVRQLYGNSGWGRIEKAKWEKVWET